MLAGVAGHVWKLARHHFVHPNIDGVLLRLLRRHAGRAAVEQLVTGDTIPICVHEAAGAVAGEQLIRNRYPALLCVAFTPVGARVFRIVHVAFRLALIACEGVIAGSTAS